MATSAVSAHPVLGTGPLVRLLLTGVLAVLLSTAHVVTNPAPASALVGTGGPKLGVQHMRPGVYERRVQYWVNVQRRRHGLRRVHLETCTDRMAERWTTHLVRRNRFYHRSMWRIINRCDAYYAGETLGRGAIWPHRLVQMWMRSPGHRHILLSRKAHRIGVGSRVDRYGRWVTTANFTRF